jgi:putative endonuclease
MFTTYIIYSKSTHRFYTGHTRDLKRRLEEHNRGKTPHSASGKPWILVFTEESPSRSVAIKLETQIKKRGAVRFLMDKGIQIG